MGSRSIGLTDHPLRRLWFGGVRTSIDLTCEGAEFELIRADPSGTSQRSHAAHPTSLHTPSPHHRKRFTLIEPFPFC